MARVPKRRLTETEKEYRRQYYQAHKERMNAQTKEWHERNRDRHRELTREWYVENRERHLAATKAWASANLPAKAQARRRRRALLAGAAGSCTEAQLAARIAYFGSRCAYCGGPFEEVDHVIAISCGGSNWPANLRPSCVSCNRKKHTKRFSDFHD